mgnify:CR=1 FL=1
MNGLHLGKLMLPRGFSTGRKTLRFDDIASTYFSVCKPNCHAKPILGELWNADETDNQQKMAF